MKKSYYFLRTSVCQKKMGEEKLPNKKDYYSTIEEKTQERGKYHKRKGFLRKMNIIVVV